MLIFSEFGRSWAYPYDHHPITSMTYVGGNVAGNRQVGKYLPNGLGADVAIIEEKNQPSVRGPCAADATTTALCILGLNFPDFFIPGGYGEVVGIRRGS